MISLHCSGIAVLGIAAIAMGEDIGSEMVLRAYNHLVNILKTFSILINPVSTVVVINFHF